MSEPVSLVLNRNHVLATTKGHIIAFAKGEPTNVPRVVMAEALAIGAVPADGELPDVPDGSKPTSLTPSDPSERAPLILAAIEKIVAANERKDFTAAGSPTVKAVERELGFDVDAREIATAWQERHDKLAAK